MLKEKISKIKNSLIKADGSSNNKKTIENLVVIYNSTNCYSCYD